MKFELKLKQYKMKNMMLTALIITLFMSCGKESASENFLPGKWNLVQTNLYQNDTLKATSYAEEINTVYYFSACETSQGNSCDMYIEEDGEKFVYTYMYDTDGSAIIIDENSIFEICTMNESELCLVRYYDSYRSEYMFTKDE
jgi:hypothetical protein